jgi:cytochrome c551/c552
MTTNPPQSDLERLFVPSLLALAFVLLAAGAVWAFQIRPAQVTAAGMAHNQETAVDAAAPPPAAVDMAQGNAVIAKGGCVACHTIPGIEGAVGQVGPNLAGIGAAAASRRPGTSAETYLRESLLEPMAFTAPDCPFGPCTPGGMPQLQLTEAELETLVNFLLTLGQ